MGGWRGGGGLWVDDGCVKGLGGDGGLEENFRKPSNFKPSQNLPKPLKTPKTPKNPQNPQNPPKAPKSD